MQVPTIQLLEKRPHLFHGVCNGIVTHALPDIFMSHYFPDWRNAYALHTLINHRGYARDDPLFGVDLNETNIRDYDTALGQMARSVLFGTSDFVGPEAPVLNVSQLAALKDHGKDLTHMRRNSSKPFYAMQ
ncbi:hypothetical protein HPB50_007862 [Hyalomma asiaticum]|uniref:Uncharacterized protein n=1 Tax=Hyalomma asiaticum TaxID=266040 RepID=A0ACB7T986_HYAAI|nr:hypothetical protein HPB50_007862 [Hyalomma asiaticum]